MNPLPAFTRSHLAMSLGWTLIHFLWQGTAIAGLTGAVLLALRSASPRLRYAVACLALAALAFAPVITFLEAPISWTIASHQNWSESVSPVTPTLPSTAADTHTTDRPQLRSVIPWVTVAWLVGVGILAIRLAGGWVQTQRLRFVGVHPVEEPWPSRLRHLQERLGLRRLIPLLESTRVHSPIVIGWIKPVILFPPGIICGLPPAQVEALLAHELAHIVRHDVLVNLLQRVVETVLFYHPAVWWLSGVIRNEREVCCDELAAEVLSDRTELAHALVSLAEQQLTVPGLAVAADGGQLGQRVRRLLGNSAGSAASSWPWRTLYLSFVVALIATGVWLWPQVTAPTLYQSTARIQLPRDVDPLNPSTPSSYYPYWLQTQLELFRGNALLTHVVASLELTKKWASPGGNVISQSEALQHLRRHVKVRQIANTWIAEVCFADSNPQIAEEVANRIADAFLEIRLSWINRRAFDQLNFFSREARSAEVEMANKMRDLETFEKERQAGKTFEPGARETLQLKYDLAKSALESVLSKARKADLSSKIGDRDAPGGPLILDRAIRADRPTRWVYPSE